MLRIAAALGMLAVAGAMHTSDQPSPKPDKPVAPVVDPQPSFDPTVIDGDLPEAEGRCPCGDDCPCGAKAATVKQDLTVDPVTGIEVSGPSVIMISAKWCGPCQAEKKS